MYDKFCIIRDPLSGRPFEIKVDNSLSSKEVLKTLLSKQFPNTQIQLGSARSEKSYVYYKIEKWEALK